MLGKCPCFKMSSGLHSDVNKDEKWLVTRFLGASIIKRKAGPQEWHKTQMDTSSKRAKSFRRGGEPDWHYVVTQARESQLGPVS